MHIVQDKVKCHKIVAAFVRALSDKFPEGQFKPEFLAWSDVAFEYINRILKDDGSSILVLIDKDFGNQRFISMIVKQLIPTLDKKRVFMLYLDRQSEKSFLEECPVFDNCSRVNLEELNHEEAAQLAYEALIAR